MNDAEPFKLNQVTLFENKWIRLVEKEYKAFSDGDSVDYFTIERANFVVVVPRTKKRDFILVRQFRHGIEKTILNFPMGVIDGSEDAEAAAKRELREETEYQSNRLTDCGLYYLAPQILSSTFRVFFADECEKDIVTNFKRDPEIVMNEFLSSQTIEKSILQKDLQDAASLCAWYMTNRVRS